MLIVVVILCIFTIFGLALKVMVDHLTRKVDLLSTRNVFYAGFILFQFFPIAVSLGADMYMKRLVPADPARAGVIFLVLGWSFLLIFNLVYASGWISNSLAKHVYSKFPVPSANALVGIAFVFLVLGAFNRFVVMTTPLINTLGAIFSIGFLSAAAGCAVWAWLPRLWNPIYAIPSGFIILSSVAISTHLSFGRRDTLSVIIACIWAAYWGYLRPRGNFVVFSRLGAIAAAGILLLAVMSATRGEGGELRGVGQIVSDIASADVGAGISHMAKVQDSGPVTLYLIDTRPGSFPYDTLHTLVYFITQPIPRAIWEGKPSALGQEIVAQAGVRNLARGFSYGPGIIGHIANDNPWIALPIYAFMFAVALRLLDRVCQLHPYNPFVTIPVGAMLGELMAIPRGEVGLFMFRALFMFLTAWFGMWAVARLMIASGLQLRSADAADDEFEEDDVQDWDAPAESDPSGEPGRTDPPDYFPSLEGRRGRHQAQPHTD